MPGSKIELGDLTIEPIRAADAHANFDLTMYVQEGEGRTSSDYYNETNSLWEASAYALQRLRSQRS